MSEAGHNSSGIVGEHKQLRSYIERIERLNEEKAVLGEDIKNVFLEAKGSGFDVKIMRKLIRRRKMNKDDRAEEDSLLELYEHAMEMFE